MISVNFLEYYFYCILGHFILFSAAVQYCKRTIQIHFVIVWLW